ncbi:MAG: FecR family protein [Hyphomonadaceae bacterium]
MTRERTSFPPADARSLEEAARWDVRLAREDACEADFQAFAAWAAARPEHRRAADAVAAANAAIAENTAAFASMRPARPFMASRRAWLAGGAGLAACALGAAVLLRPAPAPLAWTRYATSRDASWAFALMDGSRVQLNRGSAIKVALSATARRVVMEDAEASFDIAHDPARPFLIDAGAQRIRVIGTEFNVLNHGGRTAISVRRGIVSVSALADPERAGVRLVRGQQFIHAPGAPPLVANVDPDAAFSWQAGRLVYDDADLSQVVSDLNRYFSQPVRLEGAEAARLRFSGVLTLDS